MDEWRVERLQKLPSAQEFAAEVESRNMPLVYEASIENWPACSKWLPAKGGFDYLRTIAGGEIVQAMLSTSGNTFYGDIRSHERVELTFGEYLDYAQCVYTEASAHIEEKGHANIENLGLSCTTRLYLAQVPMFNKDEGTPPLKALMADIAMPSNLNPTSVANINLWMTAYESKSSTHYDPYHNILCVVVGKKKVTLWPPSVTPYLYPHPVYGEASNHSSVDFLKPDERKHPLFKHAMDSCQVATLRAGDALFIPEGWYHQVDSESFTIAVNVWWPSMVTSALDSHMSGYYLRRIVSSLLDSEKKRLVQKATSGQLLQESSFTIGRSRLPSSVKLSVSELKSDEAKVQQHSDGLNEKPQCDRSKRNGRSQAFEMLSPIQKQCLCCLVQTCKPDTDAEHSKRIGWESLPSVEKVDDSLFIHPGPMSLIPIEDAVAHAFGILNPFDLKEVLLVMVDHFPRTLEVLVCRKLSPIAAEVLTRKFEEMDTILSDIEQRDFYKAFYGVFEDPKVAMSALLDGKEAFSALALNCVLEAYLGLTLRSPA